jgi:hypothetical protein
MPMKNVPAVEVPRTTYLDMLSRGYARIGEFGYRSEEHGSDEARGKKDMLEMAALDGGDVAWLTTSNDSYKGEVLVRGGTHSTYHSGSDPYMHNGDVSSTTTYTTHDRYRSKTIKVVHGYAIYFVHDPALAAKQLEAGTRKWQTRMAEIPLKRAAMVDRLDVAANTVSQMDESLFLDPKVKNHYYWSMRAAQNEVKTGTCGYFDPPPMELRKATDTWGKTYCEGMLDLLKLQRIFYDVEHADTIHIGSQEIFKDPKDTRLKELHREVMDAVNYLSDNWYVIGDSMTPKLPEHLLLY